MADDTHDKITEENTAPDATPADQEVGETDVNFSMEAGTTEAPASLSDGTDTSSSDLSTSPSPDSTLPDATGDAGDAPLAPGATEDSPGAPDASSNDTTSADAPSTADDDQDVPDAHKALKGEHADGEGMTHMGTDTPDKLISNPWNDDTGNSIFKQDNHSDEPLKPGCFDEDDDDAAPSEKMDQALELLGDVRANLN